MIAPRDESEDDVVDEECVRKWAGSEDNEARDWSLCLRMTMEPRLFSLVRSSMIDSSSISSIGSVLSKTGGTPELPMLHRFLRCERSAVSAGELGDAAFVTATKVSGLNPPLITFCLGSVEGGPAMMVSEKAGLASEG